MTDILEKYKEERIKAEIFYKNIGKIKCPFFNDYIIFDSEGFHHLVYKNGVERSKNEQTTRFKLLYNAIELLKLTNTNQEFLVNFSMINRKKFKKIVKENIEVKYWGFMAIVKNIRIKVVIKMIGNGRIHFWSVFPAWNTKYYQGVKIIENFDKDFDIE